MCNFKRNVKCSKLIVAALGSGRAKRKRQAESDDGLERYIQWRETREDMKAKERESERQQRQTWQDMQTDEVSTFLNSLAPTMRRLPPEKVSMLKIKIQELIHDAAYGGVYYPQYGQDPSYRCL